MWIRLHTVFVVVTTLLMGDAGPARSSEAAPANHGLRATLALDSAVFPMGEPITARLLLEADSSLVEEGAILNGNHGAWSCTLVFTNTATGKTYERPPHDMGMPTTLRRERFVVLGEGVIEEELRVYLLSPEGQQIPPGRYRVHAAYENVGHSTAFAYPDSVTVSSIQPDPSRLWTGTVESTSVFVEITAAEPEPVELSVPQRVTYKLLMDVSQIAVHWNEHATDDVAVTRRPGYTVGLRYDARVMIDGEESDYHPRSMGGFTLSSRVAAFVLPPDISRRVFAGAALELVIDIELFETSAPPVHLWMPERGDLRVLWKGEIRDTYR